MSGVGRAQAQFTWDRQNRDFFTLKGVLESKHKGVPVKKQGRPIRASLQTGSRASLVAPGAFLRGLFARGSYVGAL